MDYQMKEGQVKLEVRAAIVGYLLQQWNVDCSKEASLSCFQYQLALANPATLYGVDNLLLAPGYEAQPKSGGRGGWWLFSLTRAPKV
jgi:hypothetical protein